MLDFNKNSDGLTKKLFTLACATMTFAGSLFLCGCGDDKTPATNDKIDSTEKVEQIVEIPEEKIKTVDTVTVGAAKIVMPELKDYTHIAPTQTELLRENAVLESPGSSLVAAYISDTTVGNRCIIMTPKQFLTQNLSINDFAKMINEMRPELKKNQVLDDAMDIVNEKLDEEFEELNIQMGQPILLGISKDEKNHFSFMLIMNANNNDNNVNITVKALVASSIVYVKNKILLVNVVKIYNNKEDIEIIKKESDKIIKKIFEANK